jgi:FkbM family methyltransferase
LNHFSVGYNAVNQIHIFLRKVRLALSPRHQLLKTRLANGVIVCGPNRAGYGGRGIYVFRDALEPEFEHLEQFLTPGGVFLDVGANIGIYTLKAAQFFRTTGGGIVLAYEPLAEMLVELNRNIAINCFENIKVRDYCLGARPASSELWVNFNRPSSAGLVGHDQAAARVHTRIRPLDDVFPHENLNRLDYIKIDVEGAEALVLAGALKTLKKYRPIVQLEISYKNAALNLPAYSEWQAPGGPNKLCLPDESAKNEIARRLGWERPAGNRQEQRERK